MRILCLTQWFQPEPFYKGLPLAKALAALGHQVEVLTGFPNYPGGRLYPGYSVRLCRREVIEGIPVSRVALYPSHDRSGMRRIINYLSFAISCLFLGPFLVRPPDVIYVYNLVTLAPAAFLLRLFWKAKVIIDIQDLWPESVINSGMLRSKMFHRLLAAVCDWVYRCADGIVVLSMGFKKELEKRGVDPKKIDVIYNWCNENELIRVPANNTLAQELGITERFNVLFAGTMGIVQGLDTLLDAALICARLEPEVQFVLVGGGVDRARLVQRTEEMGLKNVRFLPRRAPNEMGPLFALADALLVHLKDEPLFRITIPSKTQAYFYMGKPVIMALRGDAADLVNRAGAGLTCPPDDPLALAEAVITLFHTPKSVREGMGRAAANFYLEHLSMDSGVKRLEKRMRLLAETLN
ncbi:MAG: glycosyltransferase WbuB [Deltaproteobacteria bacterium CG_4_10_14_3_um_filter_51_14]|nr:MAG: glycosyltransferase WbuB [Deltaproteobacteria bacterium CG_4_10_14_3_um_filter_51_14]